MNKINSCFAKVKKAHDKLNILEKELYNQLEPFIEFDFSVTFCAGDGFCILNNGGVDDSLAIDEVAPINICINLINKYGKLTDLEFSKNII